MANNDARTQAFWTAYTWIYGPPHGVVTIHEACDALHVSIHTVRRRGTEYLRGEVDDPTHIPALPDGVTVQGGFLFFLGTVNQALLDLRYCPTPVNQLPHHDDERQAHAT